MSTDLKVQGDEARKAGRLDEAIARYKVALSAAGQVRDSLQVARVLAALGHTFADKKEHRLAIGAYEDALRLLSLEEHARERAVIRFNLGSVCLDFHGDNRWSFVAMASGVLRSALNYFTEQDHPEEFRAAQALLLRAEKEIPNSIVSDRPVN